ncbi:MAG: hypothetical protein ACYCU7_03240 [Acidimicrobiales bacterium]
MPTGHATDADERLIARCAALSVAVTVRQLQTYRRLGLISGPVVVRRGRKGTESEDYPPGAENEVKRVVDALAGLKKMHLVVLGLFGVGATPAESALFDAYRWALDRWEEHATNALARLDERGDAGPQYVRRLASEIGKAIPGSRNAWNARARATAAAERDMGDELAPTPIPTTSRDIRERDVIDLHAATLDREDGDTAPFGAILGFDEEEWRESVADIGGPPDLAEYRATLDELSYQALVEVRDMTRANWRGEIVPLLPSALASVFEERFDDPLTVGLGLSMQVLSMHATCRRIALDQVAQTGDAETA